MWATIAIGNALDVATMQNLLLLLLFNILCICI